jgi:mannose PTS system EIIA component
MIGILIISHGNLAESLIHCASHVLGKAPPQLAYFAVGTDDDPTDLLPKAQQVLESLNTGEGVIILSDMYGATPCNLVTKLLSPSHVEGVAGVNLPMLVRVLNYRDKSMKVCVEKALSGGRDGVVHFTKTGCDHHDRPADRSAA